MPVNWPEIGLVLAINLTILLTITLYMKLVGIPKLFSKGEIWVGGAIGRFMQNLAKQAEEEGEAVGSTPTGAFNIGGFKIDPGMIKSLMELYKLAQDMGIIGPGGLQGLLGGGGGGSGTGKIGL